MPELHASFPITPQTNGLAKMIVGQERKGKDEGPSCEKVNLYIPVTVIGNGPMKVGLKENLAEEGRGKSHHSIDE